MSAPAAPTIPTRPARSQNQQTEQSMPKVPPRPMRRLDRSISPRRDSYARSPLHEGGFHLPTFGQSQTKDSTLDLPARPPSVSMPSIGDEGHEYGSMVETLSRTTSHDPQVQLVSSDVKLYAPKPTLPASTAKAQTAAVTGTETPQPQSAGLATPDEDGKLSRTVTKRASFSSHHSESDRRRSIHADDLEYEHGIPNIGLRVPMSPFAGDVQAPTAQQSAFVRPPSAHGRHHFRTASGREFFGPPGSYGLHGYGSQSQSKFERLWQEKHPELVEKGQYAPSAVLPRAAWVLSSEDLNRVVRETGSYGPGDVGTPDELVGYMASEEYTQRLTSRPGSTRPASIKDGDVPLSPVVRQTSQSHDNDEVIHIGPTSRHKPKFERASSSVDDLAGGDEDGLIDEEGTMTPILASDAIEERQQYMLPAVPPTADRRENGHEHESRSSSRPASRPSSRPTSLSGGMSGPPRHLFYGHHEEEHGTSLADVHEHEPLFPEDDKAAASSERFKANPAPVRPHRRRFPSKDVWEDAPNSAQLQAEVDAPEMTEEEKAEANTEAEQPASIAVQRANQVEGEEAGSFLSQHTKDFAKSPKNPVSRLQRPGLKQRFPSRDIWEDTPESHKLETELSGSDDDAAQSPEETKVSPVIPTRPARRLSEEDAPADTVRTKPVVPARPANRQGSADSGSSGGAVTKQTSATSDTSESRAPPPTKPKPTTGRIGGKIAALQAGFLENLNSRLSSGPVAIPKAAPAEEVKEEPLADARKSRARGPQRRKPEAARAAEEQPHLVKMSGCSFVMPVTIWEVEGESGAVNVGKDDTAEATTSVEDESTSGSNPTSTENKIALDESTADDVDHSKDLDGVTEEVAKLKSSYSAHPELGSGPTSTAIAEEPVNLKADQAAPESGMSTREAEKEDALET